MADYCGKCKKILLELRLPMEEPYSYDFCQCINPSSYFAEDHSLTYIDSGESEKEQERKELRELIQEVLRIQSEMLRLLKKND